MIDITYLSASSAKEFHKSPAHYLRYKLRPDEPSPAMEWGKAVHKIILEQDTFDDKYFIIDEGAIMAELQDNKSPRATKVYKDWYASQQEAAGDRKMWNRGEWTVLQRIRDEVWSNPQTTPYLVNSRKEVELNGEIHGVRFIGYADILGDTFIADVKTTQSAHPQDFQRTAFNGLFHLQAAVYSELTGINNFSFIALEATADPIVQVYKMDTEYLSYGKALLRSICERFKMWDGTADGYASTELMLTAPRWA
jgi:hypothetical protein